MGENKEYIVLPDDKGSINISEDVISTIAASAAADVEGVAALSAGGKDILGKKSNAKGVKIRTEDAGITVDVTILVKIGCAVNEVASAVQESIMTSIEAMTGFTVAAVNVSVCGIALDK